MRILGSTWAVWKTLHSCVLKQGVLIRYWLPPLLWVVLIFGGSTDLLSERHTSRFIEPILHWLAPDLSEATIHRIQYGIRKIGHLTEYAFLAALLFRALRGPSVDQPRPRPGRHVLWAFFLAIGYAATDELHQSTVATRYASAWDVLIDATGAAIGLAAWWLIEKRRSRR